MINRFNPYVCEVFYSDEVILVEGDTEAIVFRYILDKYYSDRDIYLSLIHISLMSFIIFTISGIYLNYKNRIK